MGHPTNRLRLGYQPQGSTLSSIHQGKSMISHDKTVMSITAWRTTKHKFRSYCWWCRANTWNTSMTFPIRILMSITLDILQKFAANSCKIDVRFPSAGPSYLIWFLLSWGDFRLFHGSWPGQLTLRPQSALALGTIWLCEPQRRSRLDYLGTYLGKQTWLWFTMV